MRTKERSAGACAGIRALAVLALASIWLPSPPAAADPPEPVDFEAGALVIPMDTDYQDSGMLEAFGLLYSLLEQSIPVHWAIQYGKTFGDADLVADAVDLETGEVVTAHGYRGGPFVIEAPEADTAIPVITAWQAAHSTTVHVATSPFSATIAKTMVAAPSIAVLSDGNEDIAYGYLNAAGIPDSTGSEWLPGSPDGLTVDAIRGPTDTVHDDGALFDGDGDPRYCELMSMHWGVADRDQPGGEEVVAEVRSFLGFRTHFFAECQAVNAFENAINGRFLTYNGFLITADPDPLVYINSWYPFAQMDGAFATVGGSERSYSLPAGDVYKDLDIVMMTGDTSPLVGNMDLWMTGYLDGECSIGTVTGIECTTGVGKISYLGGHSYETQVPITENPASQGTRLFLNSLFEADCVALETQPDVQVTKSAPASVTTPEVTFTFDFANAGASLAGAAVLVDALPAGTTFVSATGGGVASGGTVTWDLGNLGIGESGTVSVTVSLGGFGVYLNDGTLSFMSGATLVDVESNTVAVYYGIDSDADGLVDILEVAIGTDPEDGDSDDDGVGDGDEPEFDDDTDGDGLINAMDPDSDGDGINDGTEMGVTEPGPDTDTGKGNFVPDEDPSTTTDPLDPDTDDGGVSDGIEDRDHDGAVDEGETDPLDPSDDHLLPDGDGDTLPDDYEIEIGTDPDDADSDDDGVRDGDEPGFDEDSDGDGLINAMDPDSDDDGIKDGTEMGVTEPDDDTDVGAGNFVPDEDPDTTTDPLDPDTDGGGALDGDEDRNHDGALDPGECDPLDPADDPTCEAEETVLVATGAGPIISCAIEGKPGAGTSGVPILFLAALLAAWRLARGRSR